ncbi:MAG: hypothetical protein L3J82_04580 [Planctomycetes bacterium]|nr:hypothetical protein [Planctomycetota bacterium]
MGLENYSKRQRFFMGVLVIGLAATFTVSGAMIAAVSDQGASPNAGVFNDKEIRLANFDNRRRVLDLVRRLDAFSNESGKIYGHVPTMPVRAQEDAPFIQEISLLRIWPQYQDQWVWCHMALAEEAEKAGTNRPSNVFVTQQLINMMNEGADPLDIIEEKTLPRQFKRRYNMNLIDVMKTLQECFMVGDYVESLLADEHTRLDKISEINTGNKEEIKAEVVRLLTDAFMTQAEKEVKREYFAYRSARIVAGFGVSSMQAKYDGFERAYDNESRDLKQEPVFSFDIIFAYPDGFEAKYRDDDERKVELENRARLIYLAVRDEMFKASKDQIADVDGRFSKEEGLLQGEIKLMTDTQKAEWKKSTRETMEEYLTFRESKGKLNEFLKRDNALLAVQASLSALLAELAQIKKDNTRELGAETQVLQKRQGIHQALKSYLTAVRSSFDGINTTGERIRNMKASHLELSTDAQINALVNNLLTQLRQLDTHNLENVLSKTNAIIANYEKSGDSAKAALADFLAEEEHKTEAGDAKGPREIEARTEQLEIDVKKQEELIKLRDTKSKLVEEFALSFRAEVARMQLAVSAAKEGDEKLRKQVLLGFLNEFPLTISLLIEEAQDSIVPEDEIDEQSEAAELIRADIEARNSSKNKDAENTMGLALNKMCGDLGLSMKENEYKELTWEDVIVHEDLGYLQSVDGAKEFLEGASNHVGKVSEILAVPGKGYILLRLTEKTPGYTQGRIDAKERILKLAAMHRARELTVDALTELRRDIVDNGWDSAVSKAATKYGVNFKKFETKYFADKEDLPGVWSTNDTEFTESASSPVSGNPDAPFMTRIKAIKASEGVTEIFAEKKLTDPLRRSDREEWSYGLARIIDRKIIVRRMEPTAMDETSWGSPAKIRRDRHVASGNVVRRLVQPSWLLDEDEYEITRFKRPSENDDEEDEESEE